MWVLVRGGSSHICPSRPRRTRQFALKIMDVLLWRKAQRVPAGRGKKGGAAAGLYCRYPRSTSSLIRSEFRRVLTAKWFWVIQTWLGIWKCSPLCRGPPGPRFQETPQCSRRLQIARLCSSETVSKKERERGRPQSRHRHVGCYSPLTSYLYSRFSYLVLFARRVITWCKVTLL